MCDRKTRKRKRGEKGVRRTLDETREGGFNFQHSQLLLNEKTANLIRYARKDETMVINQSKWKRKTSSSSSSTAELLLYNSSISVKKKGGTRRRKREPYFTDWLYTRCRQLLHIKWHLIISSWGMRATITRLLADGFIIAHILFFLSFFFTCGRRCAFIWRSADHLCNFNSCIRREFCLLFFFLLLNYNNNHS